MLLLVTDTSGRDGRVGLARADEKSNASRIEIIEEAPLAGGTFSAQLVPRIAELLSEHRLSKVDVAAFIVVAGPGSFTGLRVGLAAIKALAEILHKPIVAVSLLEVLALSAGTEGNVVAAMDAGRVEAYIGEYAVKDSAQLVEERLMPKQDIPSFARGRAVSTTDALLAETARKSGLTVTVLESISTAAIAGLGWQKLLRDQTVSPEQLDANYIRRTDAELFARPLTSVPPGQAPS